MSYSPDQKPQLNLNIVFNSCNRASINNPSTPLSINKTQFNFYQQNCLNSQYFSNLSPMSLTENRHIKKSITPYPCWYTAEDGRNRKQDSLLITDYEQDKQNLSYEINRGQTKQYESQSPENLKKTSIQQRKNKNLELSNQSKSLIMQSIKKAIKCSNDKITTELGDVMSINSDSNVLENLSQQSRKSHSQYRYHINIQQQSSPSNLQSSSETMTMVPMVLSQRPQSEFEYEPKNNLNKEKNTISEENEVIEYFLTEEDSQTQYDMSTDGYTLLNELKSELQSIISDKSHKIKNNNPNSRKRTSKKSLQNDFRTNQNFFKRQDNKISYCDILEDKIRQLGNNIAILHEKVCNEKSQSVVNNFFQDQNKKRSTMQSLDSRHESSMATINPKQISSIQLEIKNQKKLIYHDSKIIFSKNDSGFVQFSQEFSQILNESCQQMSNKSDISSNKGNSRKIVVENSPISIDISQQLNHVLGNQCGSSQQGSILSERSGNKNLEHFLKLQGQFSGNNRNIFLGNESYLNDNNSSMQSPKSYNFMAIQKQQFGLSFPKFLIQNQSQLSHYDDIYNTSPKNKEENSFTSQSSNQTFIQNQINKKFNNKFNQWLLMS